MKEEETGKVKGDKWPLPKAGGGTKITILTRGIR